ncbi:FAD/NAD(P)-binding domain-containing protein [Polychaeton citri CBS 116435]|uniref:FAD/NAD(P)-binding domain-containing protein n=1 Tax=Polychaeton citri CBS 116435 TaxID=1314669 RepID=A0A9P4Q637_9PEZI|nr:FAD/NAD(P)-binding domain-containing protein [Polychaeton citri CBS 116435]
MAPLSILIVGCGIGGPTVASFLLLSSTSVQDKPHVTIVERTPAIKVQGQNIDIRGAGATVIRKLGLESAIRSSTTGEKGSQFVDANNRVWGARAADESGRVQTGTSDIEILRGRLADLCYRRNLTISEDVKKAGGAGVDYIFDDYLDELDQDGQKVHVRFARSGERKSFDLVVGADGLQSRTRRMVWGKEGENDRLHRLGMYGAFFSLPKSETDTDWRRWYHAPGKRSIMVRPSSQKDTTTVFMTICNEEDARLREVAMDGSKGIDAQKALLKDYFHDAGWESKRLIKGMEASDDFYYDIIGQVKMESWSKGRVVLLGDAGYCGSPVSGMGTTLALNGAYNLAGALSLHPEDHTAAFAAYEERMRPIVERAQKLPPGIQRIFGLETAWGIFTFHVIFRFFSLFNWSGLAALMFKFFGSPASSVPVEDFGFKQLPEWHDY